MRLFPDIVAGTIGGWAQVGMYGSTPLSLNVSSNLRICVSLVAGHPFDTLVLDTAFDFLDGGLSV